MVYVDRVPYTYIVRVWLHYNGVTYSYEDAFEDAHMAEYQYTDGNYGCDCNRSLFIARHCDPDFPDMECGETIELLRLEHIAG